MAYLAFYRTFRPNTFDEVVRQEHIVRILKNQIETDKVGHAYLFCGPRGTGKTTLAKIFARAINCESPVNGSACGKCATCRALAEGSSLDISEIDAASNNGVDEMRDLREKVQYPPVAGKYKVYIIDEVHMLTQSAFNAVLKTLEEPPKHAVFILATTEPQKIPATILSRCMRFDFKLLPLKDLEDLVRSVYEKTGKEYEEEAITAIARAGAGSARDSLSIADMCSSYSRGKLTYADVNAVLGGAEYSKLAHICGRILAEDASAALTAVEEILATGKSVGVLLKDMLGFLNNCTIVKVCKNPREIVNLPEDTYKLIEDAAEHADGHKLLRVTEILSKAENDMRYTLNGRITLETAVLKCAMPQTDYDIDALIGKINALESKIEKGAKIVAEAPAASQPVPQPVPQPVSQPAPRPNPPARPATQPRVEAKKPVLSEETSAENPFEEKAAPAAKAEDVQSTLWGDGAAGAGKAKTLGDADKRTLFARFLKCLRTTHKNAVLFTLCMDLDSAFEGDKFVLITENETVYKALSRPENDKFISGVLAELGAVEYEVRFRKKGESDYEKAVRELKQNFGGTDINIK